MKFKLPDNLLELSSEELAALVNEILDEYNELKDVEKPSKDQLAAIKDLGSALKEVRAAKIEVEDAEAAAEQELADARAELEAEDGPEDDEDPEEDPEEEPEEEPAEESEKEPVLAAAKGTRRPGVVRKAASKTKPPVAPEEEPEVSGAVITAAADVKGFGVGQVLNGLSEMTEAFRQRGMSLPSRGHSAQTARASVATIHKPRPADAGPAILDSDTPQAALQRIFAAAKEARHASYDGLQAITAAAFGWVTPSENLYDLCSWATVSGLLALPSIPVSRGGINFVDPTSLTYDDVFADADGSFTYTEAQLESNPTKPLLEITAPEWEDVRLDVFGWGMKLPIPLRSSFPELLEWYVENAAVAYQHKLNANVINRVLTYLGGAVNFVEHGSAASDLLEAIEVAVLALRQKYFLDENAVIAGMAPRWIKSAIRIDLSRRNGYANPFDVTDAQIESWFRARGIQFQYVIDWSGQDLSGSAINLPNSARFAVWVPGTFVRGGDGIIDLSAIYDTAGIQKNEYTAAFFEESLLVANTCGQGRLEEVSLSYYGLSGAPILGADAS